MKKLWTIVLVIVFANAFAAGGFAGWLVATGRLNVDRLTRIRQMLSETVAQEHKRLAEEQAQADAEAAAKDQVLTGPPRTASELVAMRLEATDVDMQRIERLRREVEDLQRKLRRDQAILDEQAAEFNKSRNEFNAMRDRLANIEGSAQFKKSVGVLESLKSADAKATLDVLLKKGEKEQVVSYLNALEDRTRAGIMTQFIKDGQQDLAAELLESLRKRGLEAIANGETPDAPGG